MRVAGPLVKTDTRLALTLVCDCGCDDCAGEYHHCLTHASGCHMMPGCGYVQGADHASCAGERRPWHTPTPVTSQNTPGPGTVGSESTTTSEEDTPMASHATQAGKALERDKAGRPNLTVVSSVAGPGKTLHAPEPKDPNPGMTKGDAARAAKVAELPDYQQAEYKRLVEDGTRHVTALAAARKIPDPATAASAGDDAAAQAAALFAAFAAGAGGAAAPPVTVAAATGKPVPDAPAPDKPADPKPKPAAPKPAAPKQAAAPKPPKPPKPATPRPVAAPGSCDRYIGTVTATGLDEVENVYDCEHGSRNGHQTVESAETCARRLLRNHPTGTPGHRLHPVKRDLNGKRLS